VDPLNSSDAPPPDVISVTTSVADDTVVLDVAGEIDGSTAPVLLRAVADAITGRRGQRVVIDTTGVDFFNSSGAALLIDAVSIAQDHGAALRIVAAAAGRVMRTLTITGLDTRLSLYATRAAALAD